MIALEETGSFLSQYWSVLTDPAHIASEGTFELVTAMILYPFARLIWNRAIRRHDREHHGQGEVDMTLLDGYGVRFMSETQKNNIRKAVCNSAQFDRLAQLNSKAF